MHISEGVLSVPVLVAGAIIAAMGVGYGLRQLSSDKMMPTALFSSAFFVASLLHIPVPPSSVHLILNGLMGIALGWAAFPAIFVALALQAFLFQFGGMTTLGVNTCIMAIPPVLCYYCLRPLLTTKHPAPRLVAAFACGALSIMSSGVLAATSLWLSGDSFITPAIALLLAHIPVAAIEGTLTLFVVGFLTRVRPEFLHLYPVEATPHA